MKTNTTRKTEINVANLVAESMKLTMKANPEASVCACIRALAKATKPMKHVRRRDFLKGVAKWAAPGTAATQYFNGRHGITH